MAEVSAVRSLQGRRIGLLTDWAWNRGGGVSEAVRTQAEFITDAGGEAIIFALADPRSPGDPAEYRGVPITTFPISGSARFGFAPRLLPELIASRLDLVHLHGIWLYPSRAGLGWAKATGKPYMVSPHGMLDPWLMARGRVQKALARLAYVDRNLRRATAIHALTASEAADIRRECGRQDSIVIPNAGPSAQPVPVSSRQPHVLYIGRIHPKKNLGALIEGWSRAQRGPHWRLTIAGWGADADVAELKRMIGAAPPSVAFTGPVFGAAKQALLGGARFIVLPSLSEGLPMAILEGWAAGTPALMTSRCNLPDSFAAGAAIDCGLSPDCIRQALELALNRSAAEWLAMAKAAHRLATGPFSAGVISSRWAQTYDGVLSMHSQDR